MNTISTTTQAQQSYLKAAESIQNLFEELGFTSETKTDPIVLKALLAKIIQDSVTESTQPYPHHYNCNCNKLG